MASQVAGRDVDLAMRQLLLREERGSNEVDKAAKRSRAAVQECRNVAHFLESNTKLRTLIVYCSLRQWNVMECGVDPRRWGEDGLLLRWEDLVEEEEKEKGSLDRCMQAISSLCCTSLHELQLIGLPISPKHLSSIFDLQHQLPSSNHHNSTTLSTSQLAPSDLNILSSGRGSGAHDLLNINIDEGATHGADRGNYSLQILSIWGLQNPDIEGDLQHAACAVPVISLPPSLRFLSLVDFHGYRPQIQFFAPPPITESIVSNDTAASQGMEGSASEGMSSNYYMSTLSSLLRCPHLNHLQGLQIYASARETLIGGDGGLRNAALSLAENNYLKAFGIGILGDAEPLLPEEFVLSIKRNTSLTTLELRNFRMPEPLGFNLLFEEGVASNQTLTHLGLRWCRGPWTLEAILDSLHDNGFLHSIDLHGTPLESSVHRPAIEAQMERNKERAETMRSLGLNLRKVQPTACRVFLCGEPYAGKTTIVKSLVNQFKPTIRKFLDKDWLLYNKCGRTRPRTKGIEVTHLERHNVKVSFWDLAGQNEYRCFHDYIFPDLSNRQSPSFFLFVWSPICPTTQEQKTGDRFCKELEYWLKFITSKTRRSKKFIPTLIIALTRKDIVPNLRAQLEGEITQLQKKFQSFITFGMSSVFEVNSRKSSSVGDLGERIFETSRSILSSVKGVLELIEKTRKHFEERVAKSTILPIITKDEYIKICEKDLKIHSSEVVDSVARLLSDSGDFIYSGSLNFVVLDTKWFCDAIMGNLIHSTGPSSTFIGQKGPGFFDKGFLKEFLEKEILSLGGGGNKKRRSTQNVSGDTLLQVLMELQVVCEDPMSSKIFMPSSLQSQGPSSSKEKVESPQDMTHFHTGRRLICDDSDHTFLTPGVFPSLQVAFFNKFPSSRVNLEVDNIVVNEQTGVDVVIQLCAIEGSHNSIDILVESSENLAYSLEWIKENILADIVKICASKMGIQGVNLVQVVIGPSKSLILKQKERKQVLLNELQNQLEEVLIRSHDITKSVYSWSSSSQKDKILDLLSDFEVQEVCKRYGGKLEEANGVLNSELKPFLQRRDAEESIVMSKDIFDREFGKILKAIFDKIEETKNDLRADMRQIYEEVVKINMNLLAFKREVQDRLQALQEIIWEREERRLPTMCLLGRDKMKVIAKVVQGLHIAQLHLLCEHRTYPHLPKDQSGLRFSYLDDESFLTMALPYMQIFLKFTFIVTKVGAHLICGAGTLIPDFSQVASLVEDWHFSMPSVPELETSSNLPHHSASSIIQQSRREYQERARIWLWNFLEKHQCDKDYNINKVFKLKPVRYKNDNKLGWLCDYHCTEGQMKNELNLISLN